MPRQPHAVQPIDDRELLALARRKPNAAVPASATPVHPAAFVATALATSSLALAAAAAAAALRGRSRLYQHTADRWDLLGVSNV